MHRNQLKKESVEEGDYSVGQHWLSAAAACAGVPAAERAGRVGPEAGQAWGGSQLPGQGEAGSQVVVMVCPRHTPFIQMTPSCSRCVLTPGEELHARLSLDFLRVAIGDYAGALEDADQVLVILREPTNPGALLVRGDALYHLGRFEHSLVSYYQASRQPDLITRCKKQG